MRYSSFALMALISTVIAMPTPQDSFGEAETRRPCSRRLWPFSLRPGLLRTRPIYLLRRLPVPDPRRLPDSPVRRRLLP